MSLNRERLDRLEPIDIFAWRINRLSPFKETDNQLEFVIRGHHLKNYFRLYKGSTPYELTQLIVNGISDSNNDTEEHYYQSDTIGKTPKDILIYETLLQDTFERFTDLSDDATVTIGTENDDVCSICKVGEHCNLWEKEGKHEDSLYAARVLSTLIKLGLKDEVEIKTASIDKLRKYNLDLTPIALEITTKKKYLDKALRYLAEKSEYIYDMPDSTYGILPEYEQKSDYRKLLESVGVDIE